jgi:hypothetical protein
MLRMKTMMKTMMAVAAIALAAGNAQAGHLSISNLPRQWTYWGIAPDGVTALDIDDWYEIADAGGRYWGTRSTQRIFVKPDGTLILGWYGALRTADGQHSWYINNGQFSPAW